MNRREVILTLGGAAAWPLAAHAQIAKLRRVAIVMGVAETAEARSWVDAFQQRLHALGWTTGQNVDFEIAWWSGGAEQMRSTMAKQVAASPDVFLVSSNFAVSLLKPIAKDVPIVFAHLGDPVGSGFAASLDRPGGNITGFAGFDSTMGGKWLQLLKETVPALQSVLTIYQPETPVHQGLFRSIENATANLGIRSIPGGVHNDAEIEQAMSSFAAGPDHGLIVLPHAIINASERFIIRTALQRRSPALFSTAGAVRAGGLVAYTYDLVDAFRRAADYVDRILHGAKPGDLPIQQPTKYEITLNLKTAKALGVEVPETILARADEVIE